MSDSISKYYERLDDIRSDVTDIVKELLGLEITITESKAETIFRGKCCTIEISEGCFMDLNYDGTRENISPLIEGDSKLGEYIVYCKRPA